MKMCVRVLVPALWMCWFLLMHPAFGQEKPKIPFEMGDSYEEVVKKIKENGYAFTVDPEASIFKLSKEARFEYFKRILTRRMPTKPRAYWMYSAGDMEELARKAAPLPDKFDWRDVDGKSFVAKVRDQASCGSCYAFGALAAAETAYNLKKGLTGDNCVDFSESFVMWCLGEKYPSHFGGCDGADYDYFELVGLVEYGVILEKQYPYTPQKPPSCAYWETPRVKFSEWNRCPCDDPSQRVELIKRAIKKYGVVDAAVLVTPAFQAYKSGIFEDTENKCRTQTGGQPCFYAQTNHAIALVGWGFDMVAGKKKEYFILRNSWGESWGEKGYMRIDVNSAQISCAVAYLVFDGN